MSLVQNLVNLVCFWISAFWTEVDSMGINSNSGSRPRRRTSVPEQLLVNEFFGQERRSYAFLFIFLGLNRQFQLISIKLEKLQICVFLLIQCKDFFKGLWLSSISNSFWNRADQFDVLKLRRKSSRYLDSLKQSLVGCDFTIGFNRKRFSASTKSKMHCAIIFWIIRSHHSHPRLPCFRFGQFSWP